jgi:hypothetical protein
MITISGNGRSIGAHSGLEGAGAWRAHSGNIIERAYLNVRRALNYQDALNLSFAPGREHPSAVQIGAAFPPEKSLVFLAALIKFAPRLNADSGAALIGVGNKNKAVVLSDK